MATYLVLGQSNPSASTNTNLFTAPSTAIVSTIVVCNTGTSDTTFNIAIRPAGMTLTTQNYIASGAAIGASQTLAMTLGIGLAATDVVTVYAGNGNVSFSAFGVENP